MARYGGFTVPIAEIEHGHTVPGLPTVALELRLSDLA
jgi:hypothetical protein